MKYIKRLFIISITAIFFSCEQTPKQASISGDIKNLPTGVKSVILRTPTQIKEIEIKDGFFKDTISVNNQFCQIKIGDFEKTIFLSQQTQLAIVADANDYQNTLKYSGKGEKVNTYLHLRENYTSNVFEKIDSINSLSSKDFSLFKNNVQNKIWKLLEKYNDIEPSVVQIEKENLTFFIQNLEQQYNTINAKYETFAKGDLSPEFTDLENYNGGTTSLKDLRGSYVYIDIWATWCPPCKAEIPYLKQIEDQFHQQNIKFVSLSIDSPSAKNAWKKMIEEKQMGGIQLFANGDTEFIEAYKISGIPRFILLDTEGKIITDNAPRPSSGQLEKIISNLL